MVGHIVIAVVALTRVPSRKEEWPEKRMAMDDRYGRSDFGRQDRYQDFDHRERGGRYQDDALGDRYARNDTALEAEAFVLEY